MKNNIIHCEIIISDKEKNKISKFVNIKRKTTETVEFLSNNYNIQITEDKDIINGYEKDYSNMQGNAIL